MRLRSVLLVAVLALLSGACGPAADLVYQGGAVYTVDPKLPWAQAVAVKDGQIVYVGDDSGVEAWIGSGTEVLHLEGKMVLPGFHDAHVHPVTGGIELGECDLNGLTSGQAVLEAVASCAGRDPAGGWIRGGGWDLPLFPGANPSRTLLDEVVSDRPIFLTAADGHSAWVNSRALELAGVTADTPDPPNGRIERDRGTGEPSGTLREAAMRLVSRHLPAYDARDYAEGLRRALARANAYGITALVEADASAPVLAAYRRLDSLGELTARVTASLAVRLEAGAAQIDSLVGVRASTERALLRAHGAKLFADGVIESRTAAVLDPYLDGSGSGALNLEPSALTDLVAGLDRAGFQVHIHAIGDRAVRVSLDAIEAARTANGPRDARHHLAHIQLIDPADQPRFAQLGVVANFQPLWAYADSYIRDLTEPALGPERSRWLYPIASVVRTGAHVAFGSDWSVSSMNPLDGIQVAVTRRAPSDSAGPAWIPEERIDLASAIRFYTIEGAYLQFEDDRTGSIAVGKDADLIVVDRNLFEIPPERIHEARVLLTHLRGREVFRSESGW